MTKAGQGGPHPEAHSICFHGSHEATLHLHKHNHSMACDLVGHVVLELVLGKAHDSLGKVLPGAWLPRPPSALQPFPGRVARPGTGGGNMDRRCCGTLAGHRWGQGRTPTLAQGQRSQLTLPLSSDCVSTRLLAHQPLLATQDDLNSQMEVTSASSFLPRFWGLAACGIGT